MNEQIPSYYSILIPEIRYNKNLKPIEKIIYSEITALTTLKGYCFASNEYLAKLYDVDTCTISRYISHLEKLNFIKIEYIKEGQIIKERRIFITVDSSVNGTVDSSVNGTVDSSVNGTVDSSVNGTVDQTIKENNTSINNINLNNKQKSPKQNSKAALFDRVDEYTSNVELRDILKQYLQFKLSHSKNYGLEQWNIQLDLLKQYANGDEECAIKKVKYAYSANYQSLVYPGELNKKNNQKQYKRQEQYTDEEYRSMSDDPDEIGF